MKLPDVVIRVLRTEVRHRHADTREREQELDARHPAQRRRATRRHPAQLVQLRGQEEPRLRFELGRSEAHVQQQGVVVRDGQHVDYGSGWLLLRA
jgi:hypothetical protein